MIEMELDGLRIILKELESGLQQAKSDTGTARDAGELALTAVLKFLDALEEFRTQGLSAPLVALQYGLFDLTQGVTVPMLEAAPFDEKGRHPEGTLRQHFRAIATNGVDILLRSNPRPSVQEACQFVARELRKAGAEAQLKQNGKAEGWKTVKSWRDEMSRRGENDQDRLIISESRRDLPKPGSLSLGQAQVVVADQIKAMLGHFPAKFLV
jgi:hypothetical protein